MSNNGLSHRNLEHGWVPEKFGAGHVEGIVAWRNC